MTDLLFRLVLLAYPRSFRDRFGAEMAKDFARARAAGRADTGRSLRVLRTLGTVAREGMAERVSALVRAVLWPNHQAHLYAPAGRYHMFWDSLRSDLQHAVRLALKTPLVTTLTVAALALGIGSTTAIVAVVDSVLVKPLPYRNGDRLVNVWSDATKLGRPRNTISPANFSDFRQMNHTLDALEGYFSFVTPTRLTSEGPTEITIGMFVTPRLFEMLGRAPLLGRHLSDGDDAGEAVLSHGYWQRRFGGDTSIVGRTLDLSGNKATVVGVMPPDFTFPYGSMLGPSGFTRTATIDLWLPIRFSGAGAAANRILTPQGQLVRGTHWFGAIGRMKPGVTVEEVQADLSQVALQLAQSYPETNDGWGAAVVRVFDQTVGDVRVPLFVLLAGVTFVLMIATVNVANLVLARSIARQRELATRVALGASGGRMIQQSLTEGLLLALAGGVAGLLLARWAVTALVALAPADLPRAHEIAIDARALSLNLVVTTLTGIFVAVLPALSAIRVSPRGALQEGSRGTVGSGFRQRARATLVVAEVALAVTLTIGAGVLLRSFTLLMSVNPGFDPSQMLTWQMNLPERIRTQEQRIAFYRDFLAAMRAIPGVVSVGGTSRLPLGSTGLTTLIAIEGRGTPVADWPEVQFRRIVGDYFESMAIPLLRGRSFTEADASPAPPVCLINQRMAAQFFPGEDPIGRQIRNSQSGPPWTIIGVVGDVKHAALDEELQPEMYVSTFQGSMVSPYMTIRATTEAATLVELVRAKAREFDRDLPIHSIQPMEAVKADSVAQRRFILVLVGIFGVLALVLAAIGVYGTMSLLVSERTQEVGVRLALGAHPSTVMKMLVAQATRLASLGVGIGVALAFALTPLMASQLYAVQPRDPLTMAAVPLVLMAVAVLAALIPARRAMKVDPVGALRYE